MPNQKLESIKIQSIKGIDNKTFKLDLHPNKPAILVAPNGFGKSSFAIAFTSFNNNRLIVEDDNVCQIKNIESPKIEIVHDGRNYLIDETQNTFSKTFGHFVINSSLYAKSKSQYMGAFMTSKASLAIEDIELIPKIPEKVSIQYSVTDNRIDLGKNGKILPNINYLLEQNELFCSLQNVEITEFEKYRTYINLIQSIKTQINNYEGTKNEIIQSLEQEVLKEFEHIECLKKLKDIVGNYTSQENDVLIYLECIQLVCIFKDSNYKKFTERCLYENRKNELNKLIKDFNTTGIDLKLDEETKNHKKRLIFKFPPVKRISNGQRDILTFIAKLFKARINLTKENNILIIDEIFDYLDDANLISFQYYITKFIEEFKNNNHNLYCILLTHLDPEYIDNYCFSRHKLQIRYLMNTGTTRQSIIKKLIQARANDENANEQISKYLLHYHVDNLMVEGYNNKNFYQSMYDEINNKYLLNEPYDSLKICLAIRIKIEEIVYNKINTILEKDKFLKTHKTKEKLNFAESLGIEIPEFYYLLGIIYNDNLHWRENRDYETPLRVKLSNLVIKNMIKTLFTIFNKGQCHDK